MHFDNVTSNNASITSLRPFSFSKAVFNFASKKVKMDRTSTKYVTIDTHRCVACWKCVEECPKKVIGTSCFLWHRHVVFNDASACIGCGKCVKACPNGVFSRFDAFDNTCRAVKISLLFEKLLPLAFVSSAITGICLHIAGHGSSHEVWHSWAVAHIVATLIWVISVCFHVWRNRHWYKTFVSKGFIKKHFVNLVLLSLFVIATFTGIILLVYVEGANSSTGLWHYKLGILLLLFSLVHSIFRK